MAATVVRTVFTAVIMMTGRSGSSALSSCRISSPSTSGIRMSRSTRSTRSARTMSSAEREAQALTDAGVVVDDEHDGTILRDFLRDEGHWRIAAVWSHAQSLPQETAVTYTNSTALDIDWRALVSDCWPTPRTSTGRASSARARREESVDRS